MSSNELLENIGFSHRSYQEKRRVECILNEHEIDIDTWPGLPTYDEIYKTMGIDINNMKELKF